MDNKDKATARIEEALKLVWPDVTGYHLELIEVMVQYFEKLAKEEKPVLRYHEKVGMDALDNIRDHIEYDLLALNEDIDEDTYLWEEDKPKNDFEKGVMSAIRMIDDRILLMRDGRL